MDCMEGRFPDSFCKALRNERLTIYGDGKQTRSFCYVTDTLRGILKLACSPGDGGMVVNLGNPNEMTILDLAQKIIYHTRSHSTMGFSSLNAR